MVKIDADIKNVLEAFSNIIFPHVLEEEGQTVEDISTNFDLPFEKTTKRYPSLSSKPSENVFQIQHETAIQNVDEKIMG